MSSKIFKVIRVLENAPKPSRHLLLSQDGECWEVRHFNSVPVGQQFEVELRDGKPDWNSIGCESSVLRNLDDPYTEVSNCWGVEVAEANHLQQGSTAVKVRRKATPMDDFPAFLKPFAERHFRNTVIHTAEQKAEWANQFVNFMLGNCEKAPYYTHAFYSRLTTLWGFSHTAQEVFHVDHFSTARKRAAFVEQIVAYVPAGDAAATWVDVERLVRGYVVQYVLPRYKKSLQTVTNMADRAELLRLLNKFGLPEDYQMPWQKIQ